MTHRKYTALLAFFAVMFSLCGFAEQIRWFDNYEAARAEAEKTGKPIFLAFRCSP